MVKVRASAFGGREAEKQVSRCLEPTKLAAALAGGRDSPFEGIT
jgi:hypothetical protein